MPKTIQSIYKELRVPPNLQRHMLRAAASAELIADHWTGPQIDTQKMLRVLLLHDVGNIVKSDFDKTPEMLEEEIHNIRYWKKVQREYVERFGKDDHFVSHILAAQVGLTDEELALLDAKIFVKNDLTLKSDDFNLKITAYVDQRIGPFGVLPLEDRLREAQGRYKDVPGSSMNNPKTEHLIECALEIERQVMQFCTIRPQDINDSSIESYMKTLPSFVM